MSELIRGGLLRFLIVNEVAGELLFLTGNGVDNVVTVEPQIHPPSNKQRWIFVPVDGKEGYYAIIQDPSSGPPGPAVGLAQVEGSNKVILSRQPGDWLPPEQVPNITPNAYKILPPPPGRVGIYQLLGKEPEGYDVVIQTFPVVPPPPHQRIPAWQPFQPE